MEKTQKRKYVKKSVKWQLGTARYKGGSRSPKKLPPDLSLLPEKTVEPKKEEPKEDNLTMLANMSRDVNYTNLMIEEINSSFQECLCEFCLCAKIHGFSHAPLNDMYLRNNGFLFE